MAKAAKGGAMRPASETEGTPGALSLLGDRVDAGGFTLISNPTALAAMQYNLRDEQISEFDLDRAKVAPGGVTVFQVPTLDGVENQEAIECIILSSQVRRAFWHDPNVTNTPPDCFSIDGFHGQGRPGGECAACPFNEFGSATKQDGSQAKGKACKERRLLLVLRESDRLPLAISAPPTSIKPVKQFLMRLPVPMFQAFVRLTLIADKNTDGKPFSKLVLEYLGHLAPEQGALLEKYAATLHKAIVAKPPTRDEVQDENTIDGTANPSEGGGGNPAEKLPD